MSIENKTPNKSVETNRRPASPFNAGRQFDSASCAPRFLSAAVAHLCVGRKVSASSAKMDIFGDTDPKKMPLHLFHGAVSIDYSTAVRADITKQDYSVCPRHWYIDAIFKCIDCGSEFEFSAKEQRFWYEERRFYVDSYPTRCVACRRKERARKTADQKPKTK